MKNFSVSLDFQTFMLLSLSKRDVYGADYQHPQLVFDRGSTQQAAFDFIRAGLDAGIVDPMVPVQRDGSGALDMWSKTFGSDFPLGLVEKIAAINPLLGPKNQEGLSPLSALLERIGSTSDHHHYPRSGLGELVAGWAACSDVHVLRELDSPDALPYSEMVSILNTKLLAPEWERLLGVLEAGGMPVVQSVDLWALQDNPAVVEALLKRGVDPFSLLSTGQPLWEAWSEKKVLAITELLAPVLGSSPEAQEANRLAAYWAGFYKVISSQRKGGLPQSVIQSALLDHLFSRPDWLTVRDHLGRSGLFYVTLVEPSCLRPFLARCPKESLAEAFQHQDNKGRNIWFYIFARSEKAGWTDKLTTQIYDQMPSSYDTAGRGLAVQWALMRAASEPAWMVPGNDSTYKASPSLPRLKSNGNIDWAFLKDVQWKVSRATSEEDKLAVVNACFALHRDFIKAVQPLFASSPGEEGPSVFERMRVWSLATLSPKDFMNNNADHDDLFGQWMDYSGVLPMDLAQFEQSFERLQKNLAKDPLLPKETERLLAAGEALHAQAKAFALSQSLPSAKAEVQRFRF